MVKRLQFKTLTLMHTFKSICLLILSFEKYLSNSLYSAEQFPKSYCTEGYMLPTHVDIYLFLLLSM